MKLTTVVTFLFIVLFLGGIIFIVTQSQTNQTQKTVAPLPPTQAITPTTQPEPQASSSAIPATWLTFTSPTYGFSIQYPPDIKHDTTTEGERFYKLGPTQSTGTELYDGISVIIKTGNLNGKVLNAWVKQKHFDTKNDPVQPKVGAIEPITIAGMNGFAFTVSSLGDITMIYLPKGDTQYLEITNGTVEPTNREQTFQQTVDLMLSSIKYMTP